MRSAFLYAMVGVGLLMAFGCTKPARLSGRLQYEDGTKIYLKPLGGEGDMVVDSAVLQGETFAFNGAYPDGIYRVDVQGQKVYFNVVLDQGHPATITSLTGLPVVITGHSGEALTRLEALDMELSERSLPLAAQIEELQRGERTPEVLEAILRVENEYSEMAAGIREQALDVVMQMPSKEMAAYMLAVELRRMSAEQMARVKEWVNALDGATAELASVARITKYIAKEEELAPGNPYLDFETLDAEGKAVRLSDVAGKDKYVLLEMWASWCPYCRKANPGLVEIYKEYKGKGFDIFGVSFDDDLEDWKKAVSDDELPWGNYVVHSRDQAEVRAANHPGTLYNVTGIPSNVLIAPDGRIMARDLDVSELRAKLVELFAEGKE